MTCSFVCKVSRAVTIDVEDLNTIRITVKESEDWWQGTVLGC